MKDIIIIGCGPAGVTAALYLKRAGIEPLIIANGRSSLEKAERIENLYGFPTVSGKELVSRSYEQLERLGIELKAEEAVDIAFSDNKTFSVVTDKSAYITRAVVLACGAGINPPDIDGFSELIGSGTSYCAVCDGFFFRGKKVGVVGSGAFAMHEAEYLSSICESVTVFCDEVPSETCAPNIAFETRKPIKLSTMQGKLSGVVLEDGTEKELLGLFSAIGVAGAFSFAKKLGLKYADGSLTVDERMSCSIPGIYAAGDCTGKPRQIAKAIYDGMTAAYSAIDFLTKSI